MNNHSKRYCPCMSNKQLTNNDDCNESEMENTTSCSNICQQNEMNCNCGFDTDYEPTFPSNPMLAQSYVPIQRMNKVFSPEVGLKMGTIFPELVSPYSPGQSQQLNEFLRATNTIGEGCNQ